MELLIKNLEKSLLIEYLEDFKELDESPLFVDKWEDKHFLLDLPLKWECSFAAFDGPKLIGFIIASHKLDNIHVHRVVVHPEYRMMNIGSMLLKKVAEETIRLGIPCLNAKVSKQQDLSRRFYNNLGFEFIKEEGENLCVTVLAAKLIDKVNSQISKRGEKNV